MGAGGRRGVPLKNPVGGVGEGTPCMTLGGNRGFRSKFHGKWREKRVQEGGYGPPLRLGVEGGTLPPL